MAKYKYVKKLVILDKGEFWMATVLVSTGVLCLLSAPTYMVFTPHVDVQMMQVFFLLVIGFFNTMNGAIRFNRKKLFKIQKKRVPLTEAEKLLGD